jgi:hypothetical protein
MTETGLVVQARSDLIKHAVRALIRRNRLSPDWIIGLIGMRGSGKSLGGANIAIRDFALDGFPMFSNMNIRMNIKVDDETAKYYNVEPGIETYQSERIEKDVLLSLDSRYDGSVLFLDEPNIDYGEARRSQSNTNLGTSDVVQELRKGQSGLIYAVINEMYVDPRIRDNTDVMIRCIDVALNPRNLAAGMKQGVLFEWQVLAWSPKLCGNGKTYRETLRPAETLQIKLEDTWNLINTFEKQVRNNYSGAKKLLRVELGEAPEVLQAKLDPMMNEIASRLDIFWNNHKKDGDYIEITSKDMCRELGFKSEDWPNLFKQYISRHFLKDYETKYPGGRAKYIIKNRELI